MKNKTKKRVGIIAMVLVVVVAIAATAGTTLAKYISSATVTSDTATVAEWGYTVTAKTTSLFSDKYNANKIVTATDGTVDVKASSKVVAPGTSNDDASGNALITINGSAQVDAKLVIKVSEFETVFLKGKTAEADELYASKEDYYPLVWTINGVEVDGNDVDAFAEALVEAFEDEVDAISLPSGKEVSVDADEDGTVTVELPVGTTITNLHLTISWKWVFSNGHDVEDTVLGALAANQSGVINTSSDDGETITKVDLDEYEEDEDYNLTVKLGFSVSVIQSTNAS